MIYLNNNLSPLPFYDDIRLQNHRKRYSYNEVFPLIIYSNFIPSFQFVIPGNYTVSQVLLYDFNTNKSIDITSSIKEAGLSVKSVESFYVVKYPGTLPIVELKLEGLYYISIKFDNELILYSDIFCSKNSVDNCLKLEYYNSYNLFYKNGVIDFSGGFKFYCYLDTEVGKPEYEFEEEATTRLGFDFIESQVSKKLYKFTFLAPEYLCDALRIVRLCDNKIIKSGLIIYDLTTFSMEPKWEDQGNLAGVDAEFETDTVIANLGGYRPDLSGGDFSNDFNNDFTNN